MNKKTARFILYAVFCCTGTLAAQETHQGNLLWLQKERNAEKNTAIINNDRGLIPIISLEGLDAASVSLGAANSAAFNAMLSKYVKVDTMPGYPVSDPTGYAHLNDDLKLCRTAIFQLSDATVYDQHLLAFLMEMEKTKTVILAISGKTDHSGFFKGLKAPVLWCKNDIPEGAAVLAQIIFGGISLDKKPIRLKYSVAEDAGVNRANLDSIALIMKEAIAATAAPGGVVMVLKDGKVIYNEAFGKHTYTGNRKTLTTDIFDMASLTKTSATTLEVMRLVEQGKLGLDSTISKYIARTRSMPDKKDIMVKEVMLHQAGFTPFIPFYTQLKPGDMSTLKSDQYPTEVADNYYIRANYYQDVMWPQMLADKALTRGRFIYSDLSMYYMKEIVEKVAATPLNVYTDLNFYKPLGMQSAGFLPRDHFPKDRIVPTTENDSWFRDMLVQGFVDDPGAAMAGGVSGHAGFFASANDMAILYQMLLNKGSYGGQQYYKPETVTTFTSGQSKVSRRGYGFDRKDPDQSKGYPSYLASPQVFGHTGYTGTCVWVDPSCNLVYIFLSNRVYPDAKRNALLSLNIRSRIQDVIYRAIKKGNN
ncbi:CubicO group peptidase, beta-lactamase class C family [Pedobacter westerhofensis]|uniref:CubicO group peptidase, beta-lactamase class C family n=1 Tax=Pedobacter westerhofensis TaxID=425512 RepID=A0A521FH88_9SPHI|nr:serine hydrolase [Pedobacter westerhofensis]SMO95562.1 CubicO group peptidase, beta-lactamase class C family [Pedobacter westerhofensis]